MAWVPTKSGAWPTVTNRLRQWRGAGVFEALLKGLTAEAAKRGKVDLSLLSVDSSTARAHHDAAGMQLGEDVLIALEKARSKGVMGKDKTGEPQTVTPSGKNDAASGADTG
ncbi:transposase [Streptomyces sp. AS58]|uniref:transposase n=1 Tax=Streptomyces sp. AS58 TaxID=1519489 RepID=UPI0006AF4498|nr:transposase [Streptomyces sp. AS58]KOV51326.1 transposase [Streptomyces sp. AS58]